MPVRFGVQPRENRAPLPRYRRRTEAGDPGGEAPSSACSFQWARRSTAATGPITPTNCRSSSCLRPQGAARSDGFTNPEYIHFAVKGALAAFFYLLPDFHDVCLSGIYTSVITCVVCSLSTIGASVQKGSAPRWRSCRRAAWCGFTDVYFPERRFSRRILVSVRRSYGAERPTSILGSPRISYAAFRSPSPSSNALFRVTGHTPSFRVVRDRFVGIALGLIVFE
jgi:hypothetical protein